MSNSAESESPDNNPLAAASTEPAGGDPTQPTTESAGSIPAEPVSATSIPAEPVSATLAQALQRWQVAVDAAAVPALERYCQLLWQHNEVLNLTRHTTYDLFVTRDLVDALELSAQLRPDEDILDIGSGGGVPGIPLAILRPDLRVSLAESVGKKAKALEEVVAELRLPVTVFAERAERLLDDLRFDAGVTRAVGSISKLTQWFRGNWISLGRLLAIKGPKWVEEQAEAQAAGLLKNLQVKVAHQYKVPGQDWESVILKIWPKGNREK
jgi:16S rRNA (guanine527-N7)-methyltransferase